MPGKSKTNPKSIYVKKDGTITQGGKTYKNKTEFKNRDKTKKKTTKKKKSIVTKIKDFFDADKTKPGFQFTKPKTAKASEIKRKDKPKKKPKQDSREANKKAAGVTGKMPRAKDSQVMKAEKDRRARAKAKAAKKKERDARADARDAKRGGFISANAMKSSAKKANKAQADRKKKRDEELLSRGRR